ncbi:MAG: hypothetical protein ACK5P6_08920 [Pseudobdellovibrionaceae bacterium]
MKWKILLAAIVAGLSYIGIVRALEPRLPQDLVAVLSSTEKKVRTTLEEPVYTALETPYGFQEEFKREDYSDLKKFQKDISGKISFRNLFDTQISFASENACEIVFTHWSRVLKLEEEDTLGSVAEIRTNPRPFYSYMTKKVKFYLRNLNEELPFIEKLLILSILEKIAENLLKVQSQGPLWRIPQEIRSLFQSVDREKILRSSKVAEMRGADCLLQMSKGSKLSLATYLVQKNVVLLDLWKEWARVLQECGQKQNCEIKTQLKVSFNPFYPLRQSYLNWLAPRGNFQAFSEKIEFLQSFEEN